VICLRIPRSAGEHFGCTWEHLGALITCLGAPTTRLGVPTTRLGVLKTSPKALTTSRRQQAWEHLGAPATSVGAPQISVKQSGQMTSSLGSLLLHLEMIANTYRSMIVKTPVFSVNSHICTYIAIDLHTVYLEWLLPVLASKSRCA
jgi:hypothetical protein